MAVVTFITSTTFKLRKPNKKSKEWPGPGRLRIRNPLISSPMKVSKVDLEMICCSARCCVDRMSVTSTERRQQCQRSRRRRRLSNCRVVRFFGFNAAKRVKLIYHRGAKRNFLQKKGSNRSVEQLWESNPEQEVNRCSGVPDNISPNDKTPNNRQ